MSNDWKRDLPGYAELRSLHEGLREGVMERWNRSLPFPDEVFDRWERAAFLGFGEGASVYESSVIIGDVAVGNGTWVGPNTILDGSAGLTIGAHCSISAGVQIYTHQTVAWSLSGGVADAARAPVTIGDRCYLGPTAIVSMGVNIGDQSVVGAGSFVNRDVPARSVVFGTPARVVGRVVESDGAFELVYDAES